MRVHYYVHGHDEDSLYRAAVTALSTFSVHEGWEIEITAYAETITAEGEIKGWRGEVEAHRPPTVPS